MPDQDQPSRRGGIPEWWYLGVEGEDTIEFKPDEPGYYCGGVEEISVRYRFRRNKLRVNTYVRAAKGARVLIDMTQIFDFKNVDLNPRADQFIDIFDSKTTESKPRDFQAIQQAIYEQIFSENLYGSCRKKPYIFDIGPDFDGRGLGIQVYLYPTYLPASLKKKCKEGRVMLRQPFIFTPVGPELQKLFVIFGSLDWMVIMRSGNKYRWADAETPVKYLRREDGKFLSVFDWNDSNKLSKEKLKNIAMLSPFFLIEEKYRAEETLGKEYLDKVFKAMENKGDTTYVVEIPTWALLLIELERTEIYEHYMEAQKHFMDFLDSSKSIVDRSLAFLLYLGYSLWVLGEVADELGIGPDVPPSGKGATRGVKRRIKHTTDVKEYTEKAIERMDDRMTKYVDNLRSMRRAAREQEAKKAIQKTINETKKRKKMLRDFYKEIDKAFPGLPVVKKKHLMQEVLANQDIPHLTQATSLRQFLKTLKRLKRKTPNWTPSRRMRAWLKWMELQNLPSRKLSKLRFSKEVKGFLRKAKFHDDRLYLLPQVGRSGRLRRFKEVVKKRLRRSTRVKVKKITPDDLKPLWGKDGAWQRAYKKVPVRDRKYISGIEGSGKSGNSFKLTGEYNDIDVTINPDLTSFGKPGEYDRALAVRKKFIIDINNEYKELTGSYLQEKGEGIFIYAGFGKGMCPYKPDEGWSDEARYVYESMEQIITAPIDLEGTLGRSRPLTEIERKLKLAALDKEVTPEIARQWIEDAVKYYNETGKPKWVGKTHKLLLRVYGEEGVKEIYGKADWKLVEMAKKAELGKESSLLHKHIEDYLRRHAGYPDIATKPERHVFVFPNEGEAMKAIEWARRKIRPGDLPEDSIAVMYIKEWPGTPDKPGEKTFELPKGGWFKH